MKTIKRYAQIFGVILTLPLLTGCAAGSATAGYALRAKEADRLTAEGEERITNRVKREIILELGGQGPSYVQQQY